MKLNTTVKKITIIILAIYGLYFLSGIWALWSGRTTKFNFFPGYSIKHGNYKDPETKFNRSDGPIIVYQNNSITAFSVVKLKDTIYKTVAKSILKDDILTCNIDETNQTFNFRLKDSLKIENDIYSEPDKMLIISDIEGNFKGFYSILKGANIINENFEWIFGKGHLVLDGDFFDRGLNVTECLWLIYKLEEDAERNGGKVHFILGNHEVMNLRQKTKYVRGKYIENGDSLKFEYKKWYSNSTELGRWLRTKNTIEQIGDYLFVHAGVKHDYPTKNINEINKNTRKSIDLNIDNELAKEDNFIGKESPIWYRGIVQEDESQEEVESTLKDFKVSKMIVGHTIVENIKYLYNQKVIAIDLQHFKNSDQNKMYALFYANKEFYIIDNKNKTVPLK